MQSTKNEALMQNDLLQNMDHLRLISLNYTIIHALYVHQFYTAAGEVKLILITF